MKYHYGVWPCPQGSGLWHYGREDERESWGWANSFQAARVRLREELRRRRKAREEADDGD